MTAVRRIRAAALPDLPDASWSNALLVGEELVMSGMTAHPATRQAAELSLIHISEPTRPLRISYA
ncbi:hypothetical protein OE303_09125, partial [Pseudomonas aeruginosa]|nr:hypothetical protein [Pseudomonas aeruginosa]